ncbi:MAG TPA: hypothetical protein ENJ80_05945 [Gammaproteobacteria bacterium]|nr:hypothetical protein [Gammaproteobacteria bacterium]
MGLQQLVFAFREKRRQRRRIKATEQARERELQEAIEHVVDEVDPRIRALGGYRKKLRPCVERTLTYCSDLVDRIPESIEASSKSWGKDPMVKAFFSTAGDLRRIFSHNKEVRDFFDRRPDAGLCYALLSMERNERTTLGMEMRGEVLKRDIKQISVSFTDHWVVKPSASEEELRKNLEQRAFDVLISYALERITELVAARDSLEEQNHLLGMQLKIAHLRSQSLAPPRGSGNIDIEDLREQAAHTGQALEQAHARLTTLDDYIDRIADVLGDPQAHLRLNRISMCLSGMNIKLDGLSSATGNTLELSEASLGKNLKRILSITRFPRDDLLPKRDFL